MGGTDALHELDAIEMPRVGESAERIGLTPRHKQIVEDRRTSPPRDRWFLRFRVPAIL